MLKRKGQNIAEYSILIALVIAAAVAMQVYVKRGLQGRVRDVVDHTGSGGEVGSTGDQLTFSAEQYEPYYLTSTATTGQQTTDTENVTDGGVTTRSTIGETTAERDQIIHPSTE